MIQAALIQETSIPGKKFLGRADVDDLDYLNSKHLTCISLFSGCGGAALGLASAGFEIRVFVEWDKYACSTLRRNWTDEMGPRTVKYPTQKRTPVILQGDITKMSTDEILQAADLRVGECSLLEGGFPCQGFSLANSRRQGDDHTTDKRNSLYLEAVRVIKEAQPRTFFLENVPGLVSMEKGAVIRMICKDLAECGYTINWNIHNAADYGVPQNRLRVLILGTRNDVAVMPAEGNLQLHIGGRAGPIYHPLWYTDKYKIQLEQWEDTHNQPRGKAV